MRIRTLDAPAHLEDLNVAVMQYVVDVVGQTPNARAAHIFDALSTTRSLRAHGATTEAKIPLLTPLQRIANSTTVYRNPRDTPPSGITPAEQLAVALRFRLSLA